MLSESKQMENYFSKRLIPDRDNLRGNTLRHAGKKQFKATAPYNRGTHSSDHSSHYELSVWVCREAI